MGWSRLPLDRCGRSVRGGGRASCRKSCQVVDAQGEKIFWFCRRGWFDPTRAACGRHAAFDASTRRGCRVRRPTTVRVGRRLDRSASLTNRKPGSICGLRADAAPPRSGRPPARLEADCEATVTARHTAGSESKPGWRAGRFRSPTDRIPGRTARAAARPAPGEAARRIQRSGRRCPGCGRCSLRLARTTKHTALPLVERPRVPLGPARDCTVRWWPFSNCCSTPSPGPPRDPRPASGRRKPPPPTPRLGRCRRASPSRHAGSGSCSRRGSRRAAWWGTHSWAAITSSQP